MPLQRYTVSLTTSSGGAASETIGPIHGRIVYIQYVKDDFANGVDFDIAAEIFGDLWNQDDVNASAIRAPKMPTHATDGTPSLYAGSGEPVEDDIHLAGEKVTFTIASGGDTKNGTFHLIVER